MNLAAQHEFDHEPTIIVDLEIPHSTDPEDYETLVELSPRLNSGLRAVLAVQIKDIIEHWRKSGNEAYYTQEELDSLIAKELG